MTRQAAPALLVEHDAPTRSVVSMALETLGLEPTAVASADEALSAIGDRVFAVAILEARLPGAMSGIELLEALKLQIPSLPVLVLGEGERPADVLAAFHAGAADVLLKPFELVQLRAALARVLARRESDAAVDFHGRVELAKSSLEAGALDAARAHLRSALGGNPLDAEAMNLYGLALELGGDFGAATQAYRAAFGFDPGYGRARRNLDRVSEQFTWLGLADAGKTDLFAASSLRLALPIFEPARDFALLAIARALSTPTSGVALGYFLDPPSESGGGAHTVARRRAYLRGSRVAGATTDSLPCVLCYAFERERAAAAARLAEAENCELSIVGAWTPPALRRALATETRALVTVAGAELPAAAAVAPVLDGDRAALRLALAINLAARTRLPLRLDAAPAIPAQASSAPARLLFEQHKLRRPLWLNGDLYVAVRVGPAEPDAPALTVGGEGATIEVA
ncbi:MAG TPA: response regulator [Polyangia bacterium]|nr:response regulator [Polyangia bacterium]